MSEFIQLNAKDGHVFDAYFCEEKNPKASIIILHEIFGLNDFIKSICREWSQKGYLVLAPALYDRLEKNIAIPYNAQGYNKALEAKQKVLMKTNKQGISGWDLQLYDIEATIKYLKNKFSLPLGMMGFSWGGTLSWLSACRLTGMDAVVAYYGTHIYQFIDEKPLYPMMLHCGEHDDLLTVHQVKEISEKHPKLNIYIYQDATHGFRCNAWQNCGEHVSQQFNGSASLLADNRTAEFFATKLNKMI